MKCVGALVVASVASTASCTVFFHHDDAPPADAASVVDACPLPVLPAACVANGFDTLSPDGEWHMTGSATTTVYGGGSGSGTVTMSAIDKQVFIQRYGCLAGFGSAASPPADSRTAVNTSGISFACDHIVGCPRGASHWTICVHADGQLVYEESTYMTSTMPGAYETTYDVTAVLTR
jgi:hypothetical protein